MCSTFQAKCYKAGMKLPAHHYYVLCKGNHSGRPMRRPCPNSFVVSATTAEEIEHLFWLNYAIFSAKGFYPYITGSVVPFITIYDYKKHMEAMLHRYPAGNAAINKMVTTLQKVDEAEARTKKQLQLLQQMKAASLQQLLR